MKYMSSELVCTIDKLFFVPCIDLEQLKAKRRLVVEFSFCHFGQKSEFAYGVEFSDF
jgi:hypothetical protein